MIIPSSNWNIYRAHVFTSSGTFDVTDDIGNFGSNIEYLVVAGGGAGAGGQPCAGGAGGWWCWWFTELQYQVFKLLDSPFAVTAFTVATDGGNGGSYTVTVGGQSGN